MRCLAAGRPLGEMPLAGVPQNGSFLSPHASSGLLLSHDLGTLLTVALLMASSPFGISISVRSVTTISRRWFNDRHKCLCLYAQALLIFCSDCILGHTIA